MALMVRTRAVAGFCNPLLVFQLTQLIPSRLLLAGSHSGITMMCASAVDSSVVLASEVTTAWHFGTSRKSFRHLDRVELIRKTGASVSQQEIAYYASIWAIDMPRSDRYWIVPQLADGFNVQDGSRAASKVCAQLLVQSAHTGLQVPSQHICKMR